MGVSPKVALPEIMKSNPKPINIPPELIARCNGTDQAERMDALFRAVLRVPHSAVVKDTAKRARARAKKT
jgi:hypothetical protein